MPGTERWWDGTAWTTQVRAAGGVAPPPPPSSGAGAAPAGGQPAGWYPDPGAPGLVRWWSGWSWVGDPQVPGSSASVGLRDVGDLVRDAWAPIGRRVGDLLSMAMAVTLPVAVLLGPLLWFALRDVELVETGWQVTGSSGYQRQYELVGVGGAQVLAILAALAALVLVTAFVWLGAARLLVGEAQGVHEPWQRALRLGLGRFWRCAGTVLAIGGLFVAGMVVLALSFLVPILLVLTIPAFVVAAVYVGARLQLAPIAAAVAPRSVQPIADTWDLVSGRVLGVFGRLFVLGLITTAVGWVAAIPAGVLQAALPGAAGNVAGAALNALVQAVSSVYVLSGSVLLWTDLGGQLDQVTAEGAGGGGPVIDGPPAR